MIYLNKGTTGLPVAGAAAAQQPAEGDGQGRPAIGENMVLNAQGGVALDEFAEGPADWLDIFFFFARLSSLFFFIATLVDCLSFTFSFYEVYCISLKAFCMDVSFSSPAASDSLRGGVR